MILILPLKSTQSIISLIIGHKPRDARNDWNAYGSFTRSIQAPIPRGLEKPPQMDSYDGTTDTYEHIENIEAVLTYRSMQGAIKCKLFISRRVGGCGLGVGKVQRRKNT